MRAGFIHGESHKIERIKKTGGRAAFGRPQIVMTDVPERKDSADSGAAAKEDPILEVGSVVTHSAKGVIHCLTIIGQIYIIDNR